MDRISIIMMNFIRWINNKSKPYYLAFVLISVGFLCLYSFLNWYFLMRTINDSISKDLANFWLPFSLSTIPFFIYFKLKIKPSEAGLEFVFLISLLATVCTAPYTIISQYYLTTATGQITQLNTIGEYNNQLKSKYYTLRNYEVSKYYAGFYSTEKKTSRTSFDYEIFIGCTILENQSDTAKDHYSAWLVRHYYKNFAEIYGDIEKREESFWNKCMQDFDTINMNSLTYLGIRDYDNNTKDFIEAILKSPKCTTAKEITIFEAFDRPFNDRNGNKLQWIIITFIICQLVFFLIQTYYGREFAKGEAFADEENRKKHQKQKIKQNPHNSKKAIG